MICFIKWATGYNILACHFQFWSFLFLHTHVSNKLLSQRRKNTADAPYSQQSMSSWADKYSRDFLDAALYCSGQVVGRGDSGKVQGSHKCSCFLCPLHELSQVVRWSVRYSRLRHWARWLSLAIPSVMTIWRQKGCPYRSQVLFIYFF